jgi:integrase
MANKAVSLYRKVKTDEGWKRYPAVISANGRVSSDRVIVAGEEKIITGGHFQLGSYEGTKRIWTRVKGNAADALAALKTAQRRALVTVEAKEAGVVVITDPKRIALRDRAKQFVSEALSRGSLEASEVYERTLTEFLDGCPKVYADQLEHSDILKFHDQLRHRGMSDRTVHNRHMALRSFLLSLKLTPDQVKEIAGKKSPRYEKTLPEIYEPAELKKFFASLVEEYDKLLFDTLLQAGLREGEVMHLEWPDFTDDYRTVKVRSKSQYGHRIKDNEERVISISLELAKRLNAYRKKHPNALLVFGARGGDSVEPDGHLLRRLKGLVRDAGLNCGRCDSCKSCEECERWFLHKFRATAITTWLRSGLDLRTVQHLAGHSSIESTMRYLRPIEGVEIQDKLAAIQWR